MAPLNRHRRLVGWMKGDERQTSLFVCLTVGLTWVDLIRPCTRRAEPKTRERQREKKSGWTWREKGGGILDEPALFFFSFSFKKKHLFFGLSPSLFLTAAMCLISYVICSRPRLTLRRPPSSPYSQTQRLAKTRLGANDTENHQKNLTQQKTKSNSSVFAGIWTCVYWWSGVMICYIPVKNH